MSLKYEMLMDPIGGANNGEGSGNSDENIKNYDCREGKVLCGGKGPGHLV